MWHMWTYVDFSTQLPSRVVLLRHGARYSYNALVLLASAGFAWGGTALSQSDYRHEWHFNFIWHKEFVTCAGMPFKKCYTI